MPNYELTLVDGVVAKDVPARGHVPAPVAVAVPVVRCQAGGSARAHVQIPFGAYQRAHVTNSRKPCCGSDCAGSAGAFDFRGGSRNGVDISAPDQEQRKANSGSLRVWCVSRC